MTAAATPPADPVPTAPPAPSAVPAALSGPPTSSANSSAQSARSSLNDFRADHLHLDERHPHGPVGNTPDAADPEATRVSVVHANSAGDSDFRAVVYIGFVPWGEKIWLSYIPVPPFVPHYDGRTTFLLIVWESETTIYRIAASDMNDPRNVKRFEREFIAQSTQPSISPEGKIKSWMVIHPDHELEKVGYTSRRPEEVKEFARIWRKSTLKMHSFWDNNSAFVEALAEFAVTKDSKDEYMRMPGKHFSHSRSLLATAISRRKDAVDDLWKEKERLRSALPIPLRRNSTYTMSVNDDGRIDVKIDGVGLDFADRQDSLSDSDVEPAPSIVSKLSVLNSEPTLYRSVPPLNIVIQIVGSRGDVQPFVALAKELKKYGHRVRLATHAVFRQFVTENSLEFYPLAGDPNELMAYMVKNPGLLPGLQSIRAGEIGKKRAMIEAILESAWKSCIETDPEVPGDQSFIADAIISNPPAFAHIHCAQRLLIPCHIYFTMPWSPTKAFPHPLTNVNYVNSSRSMTNYLSYEMVELLTWEGLGDIINNFRSKTLNLPRLSSSNGPLLLNNLRVPHTYIWSEALIPKPADWGSHIDITGFIFLDLAGSYSAPQDLLDFLARGDRPVYIGKLNGFGSIVVDDPEALTDLIFKAVEKANVRAIVSKGWGGLGGDKVVPENVYLIGNCPHDWLFKHVSAVVHHGGAGTTSAGLRAGKPTVVVPFFGDQSFWGAMVATIHAGPPPIPHKKLTVDRLVAAITFCLMPDTIEAAGLAAARISSENGAVSAAKAFHAHLPLNAIRCDVDPARKAVAYLPEFDMKVSFDTMRVLANEGKIRKDDILTYRYKVWDTVRRRVSRAKSFGDLFTSKAYDVVSSPSASRRARRKSQEENMNGKEPAAVGTTSVSNPTSPSTRRSRRRAQEDALLDKNPDVTLNPAPASSNLTRRLTKKSYDEGTMSNGVQLGRSLPDILPGPSSPPPALVSHGLLKTTASTISNAVTSLTSSISSITMKPLYTVPSDASPPTPIPPKFTTELVDSEPLPPPKPGQPLEPSQPSNLESTYSRGIMVGGGATLISANSMVTFAPSAMEDGAAVRTTSTVQPQQAVAAADESTNRAWRFARRQSRFLRRKTDDGAAGAEVARASSPDPQPQQPQQHQELALASPEEASPWEGQMELLPPRPIKSRKPLTDAELSEAFRVLVSLKEVFGGVRARPANSAAAANA
ncbi:hypothetical protein DFJ73DRAFT_664172 [Zopfochytrium polystomum]|nr:hypothetical protein DFJ73DRAFT_664172 [Zopfochytrium polystomum]